MQVTSANGMEIPYDDRGNRTDPVILLIMGLGTQMIAWPEAFCDDLGHPRLPGCSLRSSRCRKADENSKRAEVMEQSR